VDKLYLRSCNNSDFNNAKQHDENERQYKGEFDNS